MASSNFSYHDAVRPQSSVVREEAIESGFIGTLQKLKYEYRKDITNRTTLEANFREKFEALNRVRLTDAEFARLLDDLIAPQTQKHEALKTHKKGLMQQLFPSPEE